MVLVDFPFRVLSAMAAALGGRRDAADKKRRPGRPPLPGDHFARGEFDGLLGWLRERVYRHGCRFPAAGLIEHATGSPPDPRPLIAALRRKYGELYRLD